MKPLAPLASHRLPRVLFDFFKKISLGLVVAISVFFAHTPFIKAHSQLCISSCALRDRGDIHVGSGERENIL